MSRSNRQDKRIETAKRVRVIVLNDKLQPSWDGACVLADVSKGGCGLFIPGRLVKIDADMVIQITSNFQTVLRFGTARHSAPSKRAGYARLGIQFGDMPEGLDEQSWFQAMQRNAAA